MDTRPYPQYGVYKLNGLADYLHETVPLNETYKVTKQLCADTNLPEFRRMLNRFVREVVVPQRVNCGFPWRYSGSPDIRIMLPTTPELFFPFHTGLLYGHGIASAQPLAAVRRCDRGRGPSPIDADPQASSDHAG